MADNKRRRFLLRLYELMLFAALAFATVPFIKSCLSEDAQDSAGASIRLDQVSIGGTLRLPGDRAGELVLIHRQRDRQFHVFQLRQQTDGRLFPGVSDAGCSTVRVAYNRVECSRAEGDFSWDFFGAPSDAGLPALPVLKYRIEGGRLYYGAGA
ncbi:MAG: hypothetical protein ACPG43_06640 [Alcanivoracaceae bacterium]|jgi:hypothetical protein